jgi:hypothetical protein
MIQAVDAHACGEPGRVIVGGVLDVPGSTMFEKMCYLQTHADHLRKRMLREPRAYPADNCNLILPPTHPEADAGYVIMEQTEYPGMSGTNTICVATVLLETGMVPMREPATELTLESPAGLIRIRAECSNGKVRSVTFQNVPAFAAYLDAPIEVPHLAAKLLLNKPVVFAQDFAQPVVRKRNHPVIVPADHGVGGDQRVHDGLLSGLYRRREDRIHAVVRKHLKRRNPAALASSRIGG